MSRKNFENPKFANELSEGSSFFKRDQQPLQPVTPPATTPPTKPMTTPEASPTDDVMTSRRHDVTTSPTPSPKSAEASGQKRLDINTPTTSRDSLRLSTEETRALDDLRQKLKWDYDLSISKNDICRAALHALIEEVGAKGERSDALKRLKRKQSGR